MSSFEDDLSYGKRGEYFFLKLLQTKDKQARVVTGYNKGWDIVCPILGIKVECKLDRLSKKTGMVAVEFAYKGGPSGINSTEADFWGIIFHSSLSEAWMYCLVKTDVLRDLCRQAERTVEGGDSNFSSMYLLSTKKFIYNPYFESKLIKKK